MELNILDHFLCILPYALIQDRYRNFISDKKNITKNYNYNAKYILHNTCYIITNVNVKEKQEMYNNDVINAITNIVFERRKSFNNKYYGASLV